MCVCVCVWGIVMQPESKRREVRLKRNFQRIWQFGQSFLISGWANDSSPSETPLGLVGCCFPSTAYYCRVGNPTHHIRRLSTLFGCSKLDP